MKRTLRFLSFFTATMLSLLCPDKVNAQVTAISGTLYGSPINTCSTPQVIYDQLLYTITGTPQPLDSITFFISWGDGSTTTFKQETALQDSAAFQHTYNTAGTYNYSVTMTNTNNVSTTLISPQFVITNTCSALDGYAYVDNNSNCIYDLGDMVLHQVIKATNTTTSFVYYAWPDVNGHYTLDVPDGYTYDIEMASLSSGLNPTCPNTGVISQAVAGAGPYTNNLGYECTSATSDYTLSGYGPIFRPGQNRSIQVTGYGNNYCGTGLINITMQLDPLLTYTTTVSGVTPTVNGNTLTWTGLTVNQFSSINSNIHVYCDPSAVLGDSICHTAYITYSGGPDADISNDTVTFCGIISNSFDPNDKSVSPKPDAAGTIQDGEMLYYHINFQNTGNDTAYNVVVTDSLDTNLDMNTFHFIGASHPVNVTWLEGNIINFRFENIYLPDSNVNEPASHGFIDYKIAAKTGLAPATTINNTAYIYFDFNEAVITNTTLNTIETPQSVQYINNGTLAAKVFPNPANNELIVTTEGNNNFTATVYDVVGRSVAVSVTNHGKAVINTSSLANGMYILSIKAGGKDMTTKINIQH
jgi:uncharacterized repeat protein (TIGR01451 family)